MKSVLLSYSGSIHSAIVPCLSCRYTEPQFANAHLMPSVRGSINFNEVRICNSCPLQWTVTISCPLETKPGTCHKGCTFVHLFWHKTQQYKSRPWENQQSAYAKTKAQISFAVTAKLISTFVFATQIVQFLYFLKTKFPVTSHLL